MTNEEYWKKFFEKRTYEKSSRFTVKRLIEELKKYPKDAEVHITASADCHFIFAGGTDIQPILSEDGKKLELYNDEDWWWLREEEEDD